MKIQIFTLKSMTILCRRAFQCHRGIILHNLLVDFDVHGGKVTSIIQDIHSFEEKNAYQ